MSNEEEAFQSLSWKPDGTTIATTSKDKKVRLWDPRANKVAQSADSHTSNRDSIVTWLGSSNRILTSGFDLVHKAFQFHYSLTNNATLFQNRAANARFTLGTFVI